MADSETKTGNEDLGRRAPDQRREQVLNAAEELLVRQGLAATTMSQVAQRAGVAKGTVYLYFDSKDSLLAELRTRYLARFADVLETQRSGAGSPAEELDRFVDVFFSFFIDHVALHRVLFHEAGFSEEDAFAGTREHLENLLGEGVGCGDFAVSSPAATASFLLHALHGTLVDAIHASDDERAVYQQIAKELTARAVAI